jgi:hypothetical protein
MFCQIFSDVHVQINSNSMNDNIDSSGPSNDDIYLSTQLISSLSQHEDINNNNLIPSTIIDKLSSVVENDSETLRLLCIGKKFFLFLVFHLFCFHVFIFFLILFCTHAFFAGQY